MPRWLRLVRGMVGTGLVFGAGTGLIASVFGAIAWLGHKASIIEIMRDVGKFSVAGFILGMLFSSVLVVLSRVRGVKNISMRLAASLGAAAGTLYWLVLAATGGRTGWTPRLALVNLGLLLVMGTGAAVVTLLIARKAGGSPLGSGDEQQSLGAGSDDFTPKSRSKVHSSRNDD